MSVNRALTFGCRCEGTRDQRMEHWGVVTFRGNYSAFNGYRFQSSNFSAVVCVKCGAHWRTDARYVNELRRARMADGGEYRLV